MVAFCLLLNLPCGREQEQVGAAMEPGAPDAEAARVATVLCVIPSPALAVLARQGRLAAQRGSPLYPPKIGERSPLYKDQKVRNRILYTRHFSFRVIGIRGYLRFFFGGAALRQLPWLLLCRSALWESVCHWRGHPSRWTSKDGKIDAS